MSQIKCDKFDDKFQRSPLDRIELKIGLVVFEFAASFIYY